MSVLSRLRLPLAALLLGSVSHAAFAQQADPATWRTPEYLADWGLDAINAAYAYAAGFTGKGVKIGVMDSGLFAAHPEFQGGRFHPLDVTGVYGTTLRTPPPEWGGGPSNYQAPHTAGDRFNVPGAFTYDSHGTHVSGTIGATRDGLNMHGVAFDSDVYMANTGGDDGLFNDASLDYAYFKTTYEALAAAGVRAINNSWGSTPLRERYNTLPETWLNNSLYAGRQTFVDAIADVAQKGVLQVYANGNDPYPNPWYAAGLPYFRPELEANWLTVAVSTVGSNGSDFAYWSTKCGFAKYWCMIAPGEAILSTVDPRHDGSTFNVYDGSSMSAPHATGAIAILAERFPYMTSSQLRDVMMTTADAAGRRVTVPNETTGWGSINLRSAIDGPGQLLGTFVADLGQGVGDTWKNDISDVAIRARADESRTETAAWDTRKAALGLTGSFAPTAGVTAEVDAAVAAFETPRRFALAIGRELAEANEAFNQTPNATTGARLQAANANYLANRAAVDPLIGAVPPSQQNAAGLAAFETVTFPLLLADFRREASEAIRWEFAAREAQAQAYGTRARVGSLVKDGAGVLTLAGANTYTGPTTVNAGTLAVSGSITSDAVVNGGTLVADGRLLGTAQLNSGSILLNGSLAGAASVAGGAFQANGQLLSSASVTGGVMTVAASGSIAGDAAVNGGRLAADGRLLGAARLDAGEIALNGSLAGAASVNGGTFRVFGQLLSTATVKGGVLAVAASGSIAGDAGVDGGSLIADGKLLGAARLDAGSIVLNGSLAGPADVSGGRFLATGQLLATATVSGGVLAIAASGSLAGDVRITGGALVADGKLLGAARLDQGEVALNGSLAGAATVNGGTFLANGQLLSSATLTGGVLAIGATGSLAGDAFVNGGTLIADGKLFGSVRLAGGEFAGNGALAGPVAVTGGTFKVTGQLLSSATVTGGVLALASSGSIAGDASVNGGTMIADGKLLGAARLDAGDVVVNGSLAGPATVAGGTFRATGQLLSSATVTGGVLAIASSGSLAGGATVNGGTLIADGKLLGAARLDAGDVVVNGSLAGPATVAGGTFRATGQLLSSATVTGGVLAIASSGSLAGDATVNGGTLIADGRLLGAARLDAGDVVVNGSLAGPATVAGGTFRATGQLLSSATVTGGVLAIASSGSLAGDATVNGGALVADGRLVGAARLDAGDMVVNGSLAGPASVAGGTFFAAGQLLSSATVTGGVLAVGATGSLAGDAVVNGGALVADGRLLGAARLDAGEIAVNGSLAGPASVAGGTFVAAGQLLSTASVTGGVLAIGATGSLAGDASVDGGALVADGRLLGAARLDAGEIAVNGSLAGPASVAGGTFVAAGQLLSSASVTGGVLAVGTTGSLAGDASVDGGTLVADGRLLGAARLDAGLIALNGSLAGPATVAGGTFVAAGQLQSTATITGGVLAIGASGSLAGDAAVNGGLLRVDGTTAATVALASGGRLGGNGRIGALAAGAGGTVAPGASVGTLTIAGDARFAKGSLYEVEIAPDGRSDRLAVGGRVAIEGGAVQVGPENTGRLLNVAEVRGLLGARFDIIDAAGGVEGRFDTVAPNFTFIGAALDYGTDGIDLLLKRNDVAFASFAASDNGRAVAGVIDTLPVGNPVFSTLVATEDPRRLAAAFDALSGEIHAAVRTSLLGDSGLVAGTALRRLSGAAADIAPFGMTQANDGAFPATTSVWMQGLGNWADYEGAGASLSTRTGGLLVGLDAAVDQSGGRDGRLGILAGYGRTDADLGGGAGSAGIDSLHVGLYGSERWNDAFGLKAGAVYGVHSIETTRSVALAELSGMLDGDSDASTLQAFAEAGYRFDLGGVGSLEAVGLEPFANLAYVGLRSDGFRETGGPAALTAGEATDAVAFTTLGLHLAGGFHLGTAPVTVAATLGWRHAEGDTDPGARLAFAAGGDSFAVSSAAVADDAFVLDAGLQARLTKTVSVGLSYAGNLAGDDVAHAVKADLSWKF